MVRKNELVLPPSITGPMDIGRLLREVIQINEAFVQLKLRHSGAASPKLPKTSALMDHFVNQCKLNLLSETDRTTMIEFLTWMKQQAPTIHMSFSHDPSAEFLVKLVSYLRSEIDPFLLLKVGLQPNIGAGCIVRTTNRYFDFSLKQSFAAQRKLLIDKLVEHDSPAPPAEVMA